MNNQKKLKIARGKIDLLDTKIFTLIKKRTQIVKYMLGLKKFKKQIVDHKRINEILKNIKNKKWEDDFSPLDPDGTTWVDTAYSKAYVRHLFSVNEILGRQIGTIHNLGFYMWLVREARKHIIAGDFYTWKETMIKQMDKRL